jgi:hypothetical protein
MMLPSLRGDDAFSRALNWLFPHPRITPARVAIPRPSPRECMGANTLQSKNQSCFEVSLCGEVQSLKP